jgi:hypothetical protein
MYCYVVFVILLCLSVCLCLSHFSFFFLFQDIAEVVELCAKYCQENRITDPVQVLKIYQPKLVTGRPLEIESVTEAIEGDTNFIIVDRQNILQTATDEIHGLTDLRKCLEVQFYGEVIRISSYFSFISANASKNMQESKFVFVNLRNGLSSEK